MSDLLWLSMEGEDVFDTRTENNDLTIVLNNYFRSEEKDGIFEFGNPDRLASSSTKRLQLPVRRKWQSVPFSDRQAPIKQHRLFYH